MQQSAREGAGKGVMRVSENPLGVLRGAAEIAKAIGTTPRRAYWLLENNAIPATKEGDRLWVTTIDRLRAFYDGSQNGGGA